MTDPGTVLQHILTAVEQIKASQQTLQQSHHELQTQFAASKLDLEAKFAALSVTLTSQSQLPQLPETVSSAAIEVLLSHPLLSDQDRLYAQVLQLAQRLVTPEVDASVLQSAYAELLGRLVEASEDLNPTPATPRTPSSTAPLPSSAVYVAKSGRRFDSRKPPPYPCHRCGQRHWVAGPGATPCPPRPTHFSRRGAHNPAPAPRDPPTAGSQ